MVAYKLQTEIPAKTLHKTHDSFTLPKHYWESHVGEMVRMDDAEENVRTSR